MKDDPESVAWRERMKATMSHYDPKAETVTPVATTNPVRHEEVSVEPTVKYLMSIEKSQVTAKYSLENIDKSLGTIKHILVFFFWLTIIGMIVGLIAAISRLV
jgi:hypothetical protein